MSIYFAISFPSPQNLNLACDPNEVHQAAKDTLLRAVETQKKTQKIAAEAKKAFINLTITYRCLSLFFFSIAMGSLTFQLFQHAQDPEWNPTTTMVSALSTAIAAAFAQQLSSLPLETPQKVQKKEQNNRQAEAICHAASYLNASGDMALTLLDPAAAKDIPFHFETFDTYSKSIRSGHIPRDVKEAWIEIKQALALAENEQKVSDLVQRKIFPLTEWYTNYLQHDLDGLTKSTPSFQVVIEK